MYETLMQSCLVSDCSTGVLLQCVLDERIKQFVILCFILCSHFLIVNNFDASFNYDL